MRLNPKALLFDMDGTLTDARQPISQDVLDAMSSITNTLKLYLVTGSDMSKIEEQIGTENLLSLFNRVYACI